MSDQPPSDDDFPILGTPEEQATDDEKVLQALRLVSPQTSEELAGNTELEPAMVGLAIGRLAGQGLVDVNLRDGTEYVTLTG